jgi:hypothetical protein
MTRAGITRAFAQARNQSNGGSRIALRQSGIAGDVAGDDGGEPA